MAEEHHRVSIYTGSDAFEDDPLPVLSREKMRVFENYLEEKIGKHLIKKFKFNADYEDGDDPGFFEIRLVSSISIENARNIIQSLQNNLDELDDDLEYIKLWIGRMIAEKRR